MLRASFERSWIGLPFSLLAFGVIRETSMKMTKVQALAWAQDNIQRIGRLIKAQLPDRMGFVTIIFTRDENDGFMTYGSTLGRSECAQLLRECADIIETSSDTSRLAQEVKESTKPRIEREPKDAAGHHAWAGRKPTR